MTRRCRTGAGPSSGTKYRESGSHVAHRMRNSSSTCCTWRSHHPRTSIRPNAGQVVSGCGGTRLQQHECCRPCCPAPQYLLFHINLMPIQTGRGAFQDWVTAKNDSHPERLRVFGLWTSKPCFGLRSMHRFFLSLFVRGEQPRRLVCEFQPIAIAAGCSHAAVVAYVAVGDR
jgi:hypothetical protein